MKVSCRELESRAGAAMLGSSVLFFLPQKCYRRITFKMPIGVLKSFYWCAATLKICMVWMQVLCGTLYAIDWR